METRQSCKKRRNSSVSRSRDESPVSHRTRHGIASDHVATTTAPNTTTPRKQKKRVRFSDPGPRLNDSDFSSTGLTPAMKRTSFADTGFTVSTDRTPSRKARRRSAPSPRSRRSFDPMEPCDEACSERVMQFTPLRQILDTRTQRRIRRFGLSDEINHIEREKRHTATFEKRIETLLQERNALEDELRLLRQSHEISEDRMPAYEPFWTGPEICVERFENGASPLRDEISIASHQSHDEQAPTDSNEGDTFALNESALIVSDSPDFRAARDHRSPVSDSLMALDETTMDVAAQAQTGEDTEGSDMRDLTYDLEAARDAKRELFDACRSRISAFGDSGMGDILRQSSPPPDFFDNVITILTTALSRASDAAQALEGISQECSSLGFSGASADDIISDMRTHFRSARLELERAVPGETAAVGLEDGKATLSALVQRVKSLAQDLGAERKHHHGSLGREKALRGQFDNLLRRYEAAADKIGNLESSIASSASDMLHTRIRMQDLESEGQKKTVGIERLNAALGKYCEDVKSLEELVSRLENENLAAKDEYNREISQLREQVAHERRQRSAIEISTSEYESRIRQLEETLKDNRIRVCDLTAAAETLEKEHEKALENVEQQSKERHQQHEEETGTLNVRISDLTTSLDEARSEAHRLRQVNSGLEEQLKMEIDARDELLDKWAAEQARSFAYMKETVNSERRRAKVRAANWELKSDDLMSDGTTVIGSDPVTPVSMTRFVDVEMGRGKNRRRMDSGIGILTEDELLDNGDLVELRRGLDSDIDLPASDLIDA